MADRSTPFLALNTELPASQVREGTADAMVNVELDSGRLVRRDGFAVFEHDISGGQGGDSCLNLWVAPFADGDIYLVAKVGTGLWERQVYPTDALGFTEITTNWTHNALDRGWAYMWANRLHVYDRVGGSRWNPDVNAGVAYKDGLRRPSTGPLIDSAAGGEKDGRYHVHMRYYNEGTRETGVITAAQTGANMPLECRIVDDSGAISITNWAAIRVQDTDYEWTDADFMCTFGNSEYIAIGEGVEVFSYRCYLDQRVWKTQVGTAGLGRADSALDRQEYARNSGGEPPGSRFGCLYGSQGIYGGIEAGIQASYTTAFAGANNDMTFTADELGVNGNMISVEFGAGGGLVVAVGGVTGTEITITIVAGVTTANQVIAAVLASLEASRLVRVALKTDDPAGNTGLGTIPAGAAQTYLTGGAGTGGGQVMGRINFSIPECPTMVPRIEYYRMGGDNKTFNPRPWIGELVAGGEGEVNAIVAGGGSVFAFTPTSTMELVRSGDGRLSVVTRHESVGCIGTAACVGTPGDVYYLGYETFVRARGNGWTDLAKYRIRPTLRAIPSGYASQAVMGRFSSRRQVWTAIVKPGGTKPQRILVYEEDLDAFWFFDIGCLGTRATLETAFAGDNDDLLFTAETPGVIGNLVTVQYTDGATAGAEVVTVDGNAITVQIDAGNSTAAQVMTAFNNSGDAVALATCSLATGSDGTGAIPEVLGVTALTGGADDEGIEVLRELALPNAQPLMLLATDKARILAYPGSVCAYAIIDPAGANNALLYTAIEPGPAGNDITIEYTDGAVAGAEIVTVTDGTAITIQLEAGVSMAEQVADAVNADEEASSLVTVTNSGADSGLGTIPAAAGPYHLYYGSGNGYDDTVGFASRWRGHYGQPADQHEQHLDKIHTGPAENVADVVRRGIRALQTAAEVKRQWTVVLHKDEKRIMEAPPPGYADGHLFQVEYFSTQAATEKWRINEQSLEIDRM